MQWVALSLYFLNFLGKITSEVFFDKFTGMKESVKKRLDAYVADIETAPKADVPQIREEFAVWYRSQSLDDKESMKPFWEEIKKSARAIIEEIKVAMEELKSLSNDPQTP